MSLPQGYEVKAGRVDVNFETGLATPIAGQGKLVLATSTEDPSFLGARWEPRAKNRSISSTESLLLVPGDVQFSHVPECRTGRVIEMRFHSSGERHLFWLQEAPQGDLHELTEQDKAVIARLNEMANEEVEEEVDIDEEVEDDQDES